MIKKIITFLVDVRREISKITWLSKDEVIKITTIVFIMIFIATLFFLLVDISVYKVVNILLKLGN